MNNNHKFFATATNTSSFSPGLPITDFSVSVLPALLKKADVSKSSSKDKNGQMD
ncbi:hypothetical protein [Brumicola nitratireducens]|uniref:hypothetical protein n=1 Tax=Brumicola nitratireducens TaxID=300231 RepID=UPI001305364A|nr:hypothetical protein [Glaciecola nitratireducens]